MATPSKLRRGIRMMLPVLGGVVLGMVTFFAIAAPIIWAAKVLTNIPILGGVLESSLDVENKDEIIADLERSGAADVIRAEFDCLNRPPGDEQAGLCRPGLISMVGTGVMPKAAVAFIPIYVKAGQQYKVPWKVIAAVHGAKTLFGTKGNCSADGKSGGHFNFTPREWAVYGQDAGRMAAGGDRSDKCWTVSDTTQSLRDQSSASKRISYQPDGEADPRDAVDAIYATAKLLAASGARGQREWNFNGDPAEGCFVDEDFDGTFHYAPDAKEERDEEENSLGPGALVDGMSAPVAVEDLIDRNKGGKFPGSEFLYGSAAGVSSPRGNVHGGYDIYTKDLAKAYSMVSGTVTEVRDSGNRGKVYGWTIKVKTDDGRLYVFRHVRPVASTKVGQKVEAGDLIARVEPWGPTHIHLEIWKRHDGPYDISNVFDPAPTLKAIYAGGGGTGFGAVKFVKDQVGKPYEYGKAGPDAYDCSGLIYAAMRDAKVPSFPRTSYEQAAVGTVVYDGYKKGAKSANALKDARPGDLIFWPGDSPLRSLGHVAMYIGNNQAVVAPSAGKAVRIMDLEALKCEPDKEGKPRCIERITRPVKSSGAIPGNGSGNQLADTWMRVGASSGTKSEGPTQSGFVYRDSGASPMAWSELGNGKALGGLPNGTVIGITYKGKTVYAPKVDSAVGAGTLGGERRRIDMTAPLGRALKIGSGASVSITRPIGRIEVDKDTTNEELHKRVAALVAEQAGGSDPGEDGGDGGDKKDEKPPWYEFPLVGASNIEGGSGASASIQPVGKLPRKVVSPAKGVILRADRSPQGGRRIVMRDERGMIFVYSGLRGFGTDMEAGKKVGRGTQVGLLRSGELRFSIRNKENKELDAERLLSIWKQVRDDPQSLMTKKEQLDESNGNTDAHTGDLIDRLNKWIVKKAPKSPFRGQAKHIVAAGMEYGVRPEFMLAISMMENHLGTTGKVSSSEYQSWTDPKTKKRLWKRGTDCHNSFGIGGGETHGYFCYPNWREGFRGVAATLAGPVYFKRKPQPALTIAQVGAIWCPPGAANDLGNNAGWPAGVTGFFEDITGKKYNNESMSTDAKGAVYMGKPATDPVSVAVATRIGEDEPHSNCYVSQVHEWYRALSRGYNPDEKDAETKQQDLGKAAAEYAISKLGKPRHGNRYGPDRFSATGLVWASWYSAGVWLPRRADKIEEFGERIEDIDNIREGDLLFVAEGREPWIYVGGGGPAKYVTVDEKVTRVAAPRLDEEAFIVRPPAPKRTSPTGKVDDIPEELLPVYVDQALVTGVPWHVLAAIGKVQTDHGRSKADGGRRTANPDSWTGWDYDAPGATGARGLMQLTDGVWDDHATDGDGDGRVEVRNPTDAVAAAARGLAANGATRSDDVETAVLAIIGSSELKAKVMKIAKRYEEAAKTTFDGGEILGPLAPGFTPPPGAKPLQTPAGPIQVVQIDGKPVGANMAAYLLAARKAGWSGQVTSGFRSYEEQLAIWNRTAPSRRGIWVGRPGCSRHQWGIAVDVSNGNQLMEIARKNKIPIWRPMSYEDWHFEQAVPGKPGARWPLPKIAMKKYGCSG